MCRLFLRKVVVFVLILNFTGINLPFATYAGLMSTQQLIGIESISRLNKVDVLLSRQALQDQFIAMGVDPAEVKARLSILTDKELQILEQHLDRLPAGGGVLEVIGIVFVVLLILELVGVIDVFSRF